MSIGLVAVAQRDPVEAQLAARPRCCSRISTLLMLCEVRGSGRLVALERSVWMRNTRSSRPPLSPYQISEISRCGSSVSRVVVVPGRHPELDVLGVEGQPVFPVACRRAAGLARRGRRARSSMTRAWRVSVSMVMDFSSVASRPSSARAHDVLPVLVLHDEQALVLGLARRSSAGFRPIASASSSAPSIQCVGAAAHVVPARRACPGSRSGRSGIPPGRRASPCRWR